MHPLRFTADATQKVCLFFCAESAREQQFFEPDHGGNRVTHLVREPRRELAHGSESLGPDQSLLGLLEPLIREVNLLDAVTQFALICEQLLGHGTQAIAKRDELLRW